MTPLIRQQVREFVVPSESVLRIVDTSGAVYRRRGSQLVGDDTDTRDRRECSPFVQSLGYLESERSEEEEQQGERIQDSSSPMMVD